MKNENIIRDKSYAFGSHVIEGYRFLNAEQCAFIPSKQILRTQL
jgi:hypothetical protein